MILTAIFFFVIGWKTNQSRCSPLDGNCYDGNGRFQYKGRGHKDENLEVLLSRIDWLAKQSSNHSLYLTSYIKAFAITLAVIFIIYAISSHIVSVWEIVIILFASFIICFSITNLFDFHTDRYVNYYIRQNMEYIRKRYGLKIEEAPNPSNKSSLPFRTIIQDILSK